MNIRIKFVKVLYKNIIFLDLIGMLYKKKINVM